MPHAAAGPCTAGRFAAGRFTAGRGAAGRCAAGRCDTSPTDGGPGVSRLVGAGRVRAAGPAGSRRCCRGSGNGRSMGSGRERGRARSCLDVESGSFRAGGPLELAGRLSHGHRSVRRSTDEVCRRSPRHRPDSGGGHARRRTGSRRGALRRDRRRPSCPDSGSRRRGAVELRAAVVGSSGGLRRRAWRGHRPGRVGRSLRRRMSARRCAHGRRVRVADALLRPRAAGCPPAAR